MLGAGLAPAIPTGVNAAGVIIFHYPSTMARERTTGWLLLTFERPAIEAEAPTFSEGSSPISHFLLSIIYVCLMRAFFESNHDNLDVLGLVDVDGHHHNHHPHPHQY